MDDEALFFFLGAGSSKSVTGRIVVLPWRADTFLRLTWATDSPALGQPATAFDAAVPFDEGISFDGAAGEAPDRIVLAPWRADTNLRLTWAATDG